MRRNVRPVYAVLALVILAVVASVVAASLLLWDLRGRQLKRSPQETVSLTRISMAKSQQNFEAGFLDLAQI